MSLFQMDWIYVYISDSGVLVDEDGYPVFSNCPEFTSIEDAEQWLEDQDERANCVGFYKDKK